MDENRSAAPGAVRGVLFDLDGTLLDTAPDMVGALNELRREHGLEPVPFSAGREQVSRGAVALVNLGFATAPAEKLAELKLRFLTLYRARVSLETRAFAGSLELLDALEERGIRWGIVTNKPGWLTDPLLAALGLHTRARVVVSGDTLAHAKPHPLPLLHAAREIDVSPGECIYFGDDARDVQAARAAGMVSVVARFGYIPSTEDPDRWPAHGWVGSPLELLDWV